uniref:Uncharacterized protein n=2 Tax=Arion vulgaris TaxID=1028688 RepID=A0A0B7A363_9EUPU
MNTLAQLLLQDGNQQQLVSCISGVHFRQFLPSSAEHKFSVVVSAYMLMEQPSPADRLQLLHDLWTMTDNYLLLVETGTGAGFNLINEAKEFILQNSQRQSEQFLPGHVFAPCPHDKSCPKLREKNQPCLTESVLRNVDFTSQKLSEQKSKHARYSYVILKKGPRAQDTEWPRVLHPIKSDRHVHVHMCLPCGNLQHVVITKGKFDKHLYGCAGHVEQGDRLPVSLSQLTTTTSSTEQQPDTSISATSDNDFDNVNSNRRQ